MKRGWFFHPVFFLIFESLFNKKIHFLHFYQHHTVNKNIFQTPCYQILTFNNTKGLNFKNYLSIKKITNQSNFQNNLKHL